MNTRLTRRVTKLEEQLRAVRIDPIRSKGTLPKALSTSVSPSGMEVKGHPSWPAGMCRPLPIRQTQFCSRMHGGHCAIPRRGF